MQNREGRSFHTSVLRYLTDQSLQFPATPHGESRASPEQESSLGLVEVPSDSSTPLHRLQPAMLSKYAQLV